MYSRVAVATTGSLPKERQKSGGSVMRRRVLACSRRAREIWQRHAVLPGHDPPRAWRSFGDGPSRRARPLRGIHVLSWRTSQPPARRCFGKFATSNASELAEAGEGFDVKKTSRLIHDGPQEKSNQVRKRLGSCPASFGRSSSPPTRMRFFGHEARTTRTPAVNALPSRMLPPSQKT